MFSNDKFDLSDRQIKWITFVFLLVLFPAPFNIFFDFGIWPVADVFFRMIPLGFANDGGGYSIWLFPQCVFWTVIFYLLARMLSRNLSSHPKDKKYISLGIVVFLTFVLAMLPIFGIVYARNSVSISIIQFYLSDSKFPDYGQ
ncbi:MAG: hypothetical protein GY941_17320 [Planctomycetes bacterium]|nr:hypothetical protein [Planctomycetota bacterium]